MARDDQYYQLIIANIRQARLSIELLNSPEWVKDTLRFDFSVNFLSMDSKQNPYGDSGVDRNCDM